MSVMIFVDDNDPSKIVEYVAKGSYWKPREEDELAMGISPLKMIPHLVEKACITSLEPWKEKGRTERNTHTIHLNI